MKRILTSTFTLALFMTLILAVNVSAAPSDDINEPVYSTGLIWDSLEEIETNLREDPSLKFESVLPPKADLQDVFPSPGNQGQQNSCVAWAVAYGLRSQQEEAKRNWGLHTDEHLFSPGYVYNQINDGFDRGTSISEAMRLIVDQGVCTLSSFPYNASDWTTQPTLAQREEAADFRVSDWYAIRGIHSIKKRLADGDGVVIGIDVYPDFNSINTSNPIYDVVSGDYIGSHAICLIGYDDDLSAFKFINSWGMGWGLGGYGWISYDLLEDTNVNYHGVALGYVMDAYEGSIFSEASFDYVLSNNQAKIIRYTNVDSGGKVVIPETLGGYPVTEIGNRAFRNNSSITSIEIPGSVTSIGSDTFMNCTSLASVVIPNSIIFIEDGAFSGCTSLANVVIPDSVIYINVGAFSGCTSLTDISVGSDNQNYSGEGGVLFNKNQTTLIQYPAGKPDSKYIIPNIVTAIGSRSFYGSKSLTDVIIHSDIKSVGESAFYGLPDNAIIYVPNMQIQSLVENSGFPVKRIVSEELGGICGDDLIWELSRESGVLTISGTGDMWNYEGYPDYMPWYSFRNIIKEVIIDDRVTAIGDQAFYSCSLLTDVTIPDGVTYIGDWAFYACRSLISMKIPNGVTRIGRSTFSSCSSLISVEIPDSVTYIDDYAFQECTSLTSAVIPDNVTYVGHYAFYNCTSLSGVINLNNVTYIGQYAFNNCGSLNKVVIGDSVDSVGYGPFNGLPKTVKIYVPNQTIKELVADSGFPAERIIILVDSGSCGDNLIWEMDTVGTLTVLGTGEMWDYTDSDAPWYSYCDNIKKVDIEGGVTSVGAGAFDGCRIEALRINIPKIKLTFADTATLKDVTLGSCVTSIDKGAFSGLHDAVVIHVPNQTIKTLLIDSGFPEGRILWDIVESGICGDDLYWKLDSNGTLTVFGTGDMMYSYGGGSMPWDSYYNSITAVVIDNGATSISGQAFAYYPYLTDVVISDSVVIIDFMAFIRCTSLTRVVIPDSVTNIGFDAFFGAPNLTIHCYKNSYAEEYAISNEIPYEYLPNVKLGDVNGDGDVNTSDVVDFLRYSVGISVYIDKSNSDLNDDGLLDNRDATYLLRAIAGHPIESARVFGDRT